MAEMCDARAGERRAFIQCAWDVDALCTDFAAWMTTENTEPAPTSRVGILSSPQCRNLLGHYINPGLSNYLIQLVKTSSLLYSRQSAPHPHYTHEQLSSARAVLGNEVLDCLEAALSPRSLSKNSKQQHESFFIVIFGAIIAVAYTREIEQTQTELIQILTHYLILVGGRIGLLQSTVTKMQLIQGSHNLWNKTGGFKWTYDTESASYDALYEEVPP